MQGTQRQASIGVWLIPPIVALFTFGWTLRHQASARRTQPRAPSAVAAPSPKAPPEKSAASEKRGEPAPRGQSVVRGVLFAPNGAPAGPGITVHLALESQVRTQAPSAWRCCPGCTHLLFDEGCEQAAQAIALAVAFKKSAISPLQTTPTGPGGSFAFERLAKGRYAVWTPPPRGAVAVARHILALERDKRAPQEVLLQSDFRASLEGSVVASADGHPIAGAAVAAIDPRLGITFEATSDAEGLFSIEGLDRKEGYYVVASAPGMAPKGRGDVLPGDEVSLELDEAAALVGVVTSQARRVPKAKVDLDGYLRVIETAPDGTFRFDGLAPGIHAIRALSEGPGQPALGRRLELELSRGLTRNLTLELARACALSVRVVGIDGAPLSGADVRLLAKASIDHRAQKTDRAGLVAFDMLAPGPYDLDADRADRGKGSMSLRLEDGCTDGTATLMIRPAPGPGLLGKVADEKNAPLEGVEITVEPAGQESDESEDGLKSTKSDASGRFRVPALTPGRWQMIAAKEGRVSATAAFEVRDKRDVTLGLQLKEGGTIEGRLVDPADRPIGGWRVYAMIPGLEPEGGDPGPGDDASGQRKTTASDGSFRFTGLAQKAYELSAEPFPSREAGSIETSEARTRPVQAKIGDRVVLRTRGTGRLSGRVRFIGAPPPESFTVAVPGLGVKAFEGEGGKLAFESALAASYSIAIRARGFSAQTPRVSVPLNGHTEIDVSLYAPARIAGRVIDAREGTPIPDATISSWLEKKTNPSDEHPPAAVTISKKSGRFELDDLAPGQHLLIVRADGYGRGTAQTPPLEPGKDPPLVEISLERKSVRLAGRVLAKGRPLAKAVVMLDPREPRAPGAPVETSTLLVNARTGTKGRFVLESIQPGMHALAIGAKLGAGQKETVLHREIVSVPAVGLDGLEIDLFDRRGPARLVVELSGKRKGALAVSLRSGTPLDANAKKARDRDGDRLDAEDARIVGPDQREVVFEHLQPGPYTIGVSAAFRLEDSVLGAILARLRPLVARHVDLAEGETESRVAIILD